MRQFTKPIIIRWILGAALLIVMGVGVGFYTLHSILKDPLRMTPLAYRLMEKYQVEEKTKMKIHFDSLSINLFRRIHLENLKVKSLENSLDLSVALFNCEFKFWPLLSKKLKINQLVVKGVDFKAEAKKDNGVVVVQDPTQALMTREQLNAVPLAIEIDGMDLAEIVTPNVEIKKLQGSMVLGQQLLAMKIPQFDFSFKQNGMEGVGSFPFELNLDWKEEKFLNLNSVFHLITKNFLMKNEQLNLDLKNLNIQSDVSCMLPLPLFKTDLINVVQAKLNNHVKWESLSLKKEKMFFTSDAFNLDQELNLDKGKFTASTQSKSHWIDELKKRNYQLDFDWSSALQGKEVSLKTKLQLNHHPLWELDVVTDLAAMPQVVFKGHTEVQIDRSVIPSVPELKMLELYGDFLMSAQFQGKILDVKNPNVQNLEYFNLISTLEQTQIAEKGLVKLKSPIKFNLDLNSSGEGKIYGKIEGEQSLIDFKGWNIKPLISPLEIEGKWLAKDHWKAFNDLDIHFSQTLWNFSLKGNVQVEEKKANLVGNIEFKSLKQLALNKETKVKGGIKIPWTLINGEKNHYNFQASVQLKDFYFWQKDLALNAMNGDFVMEEEIALNPKNNKVEFDYLVDENPFMRVDWQKIRSVIDNKTSLFQIKEILWKNKSVGHVYFQPSIVQNRFQIENAEGSFGDGSFSGKLFFDLLPGNFRFGSLFRLTNFDPAYLLDKKDKDAKNEKKTIDARSAFIFDYKKCLLEGRMDITQLGKKQLMALLEYGDPNYTDEQMNNIRTALSFASPEVVAMIFQQGNMQMDILLEQGLSLGLKNFPLTPLIQTKIPPFNF